MAEPKITHVLDTSVELATLIEQTIERTKKTKSEVMRQALQLGLPMVEEKPPL